jgi:hypothetical protein
MGEYLKTFFSGTLVVPQDAWHRKVYEYWYRRGHFKKTGYRENLCHYVRVLLFWAPLMWFWNGQESHRVKPWMIPAVPLGLALLATPFYFWLLGTLELLAWVGCVVAIVVIAILFQEYPKRMQTIAKWSTCWFWGPILGVGIVVFATGWVLWHGAFKYIGPPLVRWFFKAHILWVVYPWTVALAAGISAAFYYEPRKSLVVLYFVLTVCFICACAVGLSMYADYLKKARIASYRSAYRASSYLDLAQPLAVAAEPEPEVPVERKPFWLLRLMYGLASITMVAVHLFSAKKKKICPFIVLEGQTPPGDLAELTDVH